MKMKQFLSGSMLCAAFALSGCSVLYESQQASALRACNLLPNWSDRQECVKRSQIAYDQYETQRRTVNESDVKNITGPVKNDSLCFKRASTEEVVCPN